MSKTTDTLWVLVTLRRRDPVRPTRPYEARESSGVNDVGRTLRVACALRELVAEWAATQGGYGRPADPESPKPPRAGRSVGSDL